MKEDKEIRNFIIIFIIVILLVVGIYFFTKFVVKKDSESTNNTETTQIETEAKIDADVAIVGTMLKKADKEYYVIIYSNKDENYSEYANLEYQYKAKEKHLPVYFVDLSNALNKKYYDKDNQVLNATDVNDLRFGDISLLKVENGKITKTYNNVDDIKNVWKLK